MKRITTLAAALAMMCAAPVFACDKDKDAAAAKHSGCSGKGAQTVAAKSGCHGEVGSMAAKVMEKLPTMTYRVGDFNTPCPHAATEKAGAEGKVQYIVDSKAYDCKGDATVALAALIESQAADMMTVRYAVGDETFGCPMAAKGAAAEKKSDLTYRLAGLTFKSQDEADKVAKRVSDAVAKLANPQDAPAAEGAPAVVGGCGKAKAETASAVGGCSKAKAETASAVGGCSKMKAETAAAGSGCCAKSKAATVSAAGGCDKAKAQTASAAPACCSKDKAAASGTPTCCDAAEKRLASAKAKLQVIIETALASSPS